MRRFFIAFSTLVFIASCKNNNITFDASGTFEADETIVSAEATGIIKTLNLEEGQQLTAGQTIGYIDSLQLYLKKKQLLAQINTVLSKRPDVSSQLAALQEQLKQALRERDRVSNLLKSDAATKKQLDDAESQVSIIKKQIEALQSSLGITSSSLNEEAIPLQVQIEQINDQLAKCNIINPLYGTVLTKYVNSNEFTTAGKPLYKIANLDSLCLRAYFTGEQFAGLKLNQIVKVTIDDEGGKSKELSGNVTWISTKAEFTPKTIQTKNERANLVYAVKIKVKNDGNLKIGMYGEVRVN